MNDQQRDSLLFDVTIEGDAAKALLHSLSPDPENGECTAIRLQAGNGHEGYGIYVSDDEYPEEGSMFLAALTQPQPQAQQAAAVPAIPSFDALDDEVIDAACVAGSLYRVDFMRAWNCVHSMLSSAPAAPQAQGWLPIELMPIEEECIVFFPMHAHYDKFGFSGRSEIRRRPSDMPDRLYPGGCDLKSATHWQLLPAPPAPVLPLSDEQRMQLFTELYAVKADNPSDMFKLIVQAVEKAHGITAHGAGGD